MHNKFDGSSSNLKLILELRTVDEDTFIIEKLMKFSVFFHRLHRAIEIDTFWLYKHKFTKSQSIPVSPFLPIPVGLTKWKKLWIFYGFMLSIFQLDFQNSMYMQTLIETGSNPIGLGFISIFALPFNKVNFNCEH
jgi:hypothetical protein